MADRGMGDAGVEPDIEDIGLFTELVVAAARTAGARWQQLAGIFFKPDIAAGCLELVGDMMHDFAIIQCFTTFFAVGDSDRYAPAALPADTPVGARFDHVVDPVAPPGRDPFNLLDFL